MSSSQHKKALVFFSAGVGDAILLVPLVNELKKQDYLVTGLFTSPFGCESIFENTSLFDDMKIKKNKILFILFSIFNFRKYDVVLLNHFSFSKASLTLAAFLGKDVYTNFKEFTSTQSSPAIHFVDPKPNTHDALQNVLLINKTATITDLNFNLKYKPKKSNFNLPKNYIVIQASSANNKAPYKNWDFENWLALFKHLQSKSPDTMLVLLGDNTELYLDEKINYTNHPNVISFIGKTTLNDTVEIIHQSRFYIGLDSGLMHIALALNKPTFTIWGASNPVLYGYEWLGSKHKIVSLNLHCAPCSSWLNANTSRVANPNQCPDFKCIREISVEKVIEELNIFIKAI